MPAARPGPDDAVWDNLGRARWRRVRWRKGLGADDAVCAAYGTPLHRDGTYYRRPVYTDGARWLSQQAYDELIRREGARATRQSGARPRAHGRSPDG